MSELINRVIELAVQIQQIPAPTFYEEKRAEFVHKLFLNEGLQDACIDEKGNVLARFPGNSEEKPLIVSAHMDTVFPLETNLQVKRGSELIHGPGLGDNSVQMCMRILLLKAWH